MGRRGPAPEPTALRVLHGNPSRRPLPLDSPQPRHVMPRRPEMLTGEARAEWDRQAPRLFALGVLTEVDGTVLTMYCQNYKRWLQAEADVERSLTATGRLSRLRTVTAHRYAQAVQQLGDKLGLNPSARTRIFAGDRNEAFADDGVLS